MAAIVDVIGYWYTLTVLLFTVPLIALHLFIRYIGSCMVKELIEQRVIDYKHQAPEYIPRWVRWNEKINDILCMNWFTVITSIMSGVVGCLFSFAAMIMMAGEGLGFGDVYLEYSQVAHLSKAVVGWYLVIAFLVFVASNAGSWYVKGYVTYLKLIKRKGGR